jgi:membrane protease YdiL (CAAX protease family)
VFLVPLLAVYEGGLLLLGGTHPEALRSGADTWLRHALEAVGLTDLYWPPVLIVVVLAGRAWLARRGRPADLLGVCSGMAIESVVCALGLWTVSRGLGPFLDSFGVHLQVSPKTSAAVLDVLSFVGAGIYEEVLFRLLLFSALVWTMRHVEVPSGTTVIAAALASALLFSAAHHFGEYGEPFDGYRFVFRTLAGLYFALVYQLRGFGVAVGGHACYDVMVGVLPL